MDSIKGEPDNKNTSANKNNINNNKGLRRTPGSQLLSSTIGCSENHNNHSDSHLSSTENSTTKNDQDDNKKNKKPKEKQPQATSTTNQRKRPCGVSSSKSRRSEVTCWFLSFALAFCLFQTFTFEMPSHLDGDHSHPAKLFVQQPKQQPKIIQQQQQQKRQQHRIEQAPANSDADVNPAALNDSHREHGHSRPRRTVMDVLREARLLDKLPSETIKILPALDRTFHNLYGGGAFSTKNNSNNNDPEGPIIYGLETCQAYQKLVPNPKDRYTGPAGMFNTGTNNVAKTLKLNLDGTLLYKRYYGTVHYQVPWGKHRMPARRLKHTAPGAEHLNQTKCLPIVIIRDPYHWMQSMCKTPYAAHWKHSVENRCPNLVATPADKKRWKRIPWDINQLHDPAIVNSYSDEQSFQVKVVFDTDDVEFFDSLVHMWNEWYRPYWENKDGYPRLLVRFEDMLMHAPTIVTQIAQCMGIGHREAFYYQTGTAKEHGSHATFLSALIKTADTERRQNGLTLKDKIFAAQYLDAELMRAFQYRVVTG